MDWGSLVKHTPFLSSLRSVLILPAIWEGRDPEALCLPPQRLWNMNMKRNGNVYMFFVQTSPYDVLKPSQIVYRVPSLYITTLKTNLYNVSSTKRNTSWLLTLQKVCYVRHLQAALLLLLHTCLLPMSLCNPQRTSWNHLCNLTRRSPVHIYSSRRRSRSSSGS